MLTSTLTNAILAATLLAAMAVPAWARSFAVPRNNPAVTIAVPDTWKIQEIDYGYSAQSPDEGVMFYMETPSAKNFDAMLKLNKSWIKDNEIDGNVKPQEREMDFNGTKGQALRYDTSDSSGKTIVDYVLFEGGGARTIMLTLWASEEERADNKADIGAIMNSVKPIQ